MSDFDPQGIIDRVVSLGLQLGMYETVNAVEPDNPPTSGVTAAVWADYLGPAPTGHGLDVTQGLLILKARSYLTALSQPADMIDPAMLRAVWAYTAALSGDFSLGIVDADGEPDAWIDLLGQSRSRLETRAGYLSQGDATFRVMTTDIPIIINNLWTQVQ